MPSTDYFENFDRTLASRAFLVQVDYFRVTDSGALSVLSENKRVTCLFSGELPVIQDNHQRNKAKHTELGTC